MNRVSNVQAVDYDDASITVNISGSNPEYKAIYHLLFRGFPESNQKTPLISTSEEEIKKQHPEYFRKFFDEKRYKTFVTSSSKNGDKTKRIVINLRALRADLEQNSIIRKFGY
jgi:hypothetical protein